MGASYGDAAVVEISPAIPFFLIGLYLAVELVSNGIACAIACAIMRRVTGRFSPWNEGDMTP